MASCSKCSAEGEFYASNPSTCKACIRARARANYYANHAERVAYERERSKRPERKAAMKAMAHKRKVTPMRKAHIAVGNAIRDGRLVRKPCERCGATVGVEAHHDDYSKPLDVRWLCPKHHMELHAKLRSAA